MDTKRISYIPTTGDYISKVVINRIPLMVRTQLKLFDPIIRKLLDIMNSTWIRMVSKDIWFNSRIGGIFPNLDEFEVSKQNIFFSFVESKFRKSFSEYEGTLMSLFELRASGIAELPQYEKCLFAYSDNNIIKAIDLAANIDYHFNTAYHFDAVCIPSVRFSKQNGLPLTGEELIPVFLENGLVPEGLSISELDSYSDLMRLYTSDCGYVFISPEGHISFDEDKLAADITSGKFKGSINGMDFSMETLLAVNRIKADEEFSAALKKKLLDCEKVRADIDSYDEKLLSDPNRGHWELWRDDDETSYTYDIEITEPLIARDPTHDINRDGVIAIDFGTKSTVVVFQRSSEHTLPMAIGTGKLFTTDSPEHYENPTVMEFTDTASFLEKYYSRVGRPETLWETLPISHTAFDDMKNSASKDYYSFFCDLKHWAGEGNYSLRICDKSGGEYLLPPYMSDEAAPFDPIELYAYYIGLYINNMRNGIFLDYYLSFPVTFEKSVRERITSSFARGLAKSLPAAVLENEQIMSEFRVDGTISEPAAYAVCALGEYGVFPEGDEEFHYGIFDFGGGTADFDFGVCRVSEKRKFDYSIENYGAGGDRYLGGENLLALLAFTVFRHNFEKIKNGGITFTLPPRCQEFAGSSAVIARSKEAEANMRHLMEKLRPLWEGTSSPGEYERGVICVDLFDKDGALLPQFELDVSEDELIGIIKQQISDGIDNFFAAMGLAYTSKNATIPQNVNIMLAGNSCRSRFVSELFESKFEYGAQMLRESLGTDSEFTFTLYPPLGTDEAYTLMESKGLDSHRGSLEHPTGKTGVAFGLIKCRKGGKIERYAMSAREDEIPFKYFIGFNKRGKFVILDDPDQPMTLRGKPDYNVWYNFTDADEDTFEIFYSPLSEAVSNSIPIENVFRRKCRLNVTYDKANVYIRATGPKTLQYVAATENGITFDTYLSKIMSVDLQ
ncbi:MAG: hypothetical protein ACI4KF_10910 [Huintestinicola sp.]